MIYTLYLWSVMVVSGDHLGVSAIKSDWRPIGEYADSNFINEGYVSAKSKCEAAVLQLGVGDRYRCVRTK
jgi:hypothetical protein